MNDNSGIQYTENYMISFAKAKRLIVDNIEELKTEYISINDALTRVCSTPIISPTSIPPFNNSAMDGYAVNASDFLNHDGGSTKLDVIGITAAGECAGDITNTKGKAWKIMTGAPVPTNFDSVIPIESTSIELTSIEHKQIDCQLKPKLNSHIRMRGEDFDKGQLVLNENSIINSSTISALTALGIANIQVYKKIDIALFSTGKELVDDPSQILKPGQIRNSNRGYILSWLSNLPVNVFSAGTNSDDIKQFEIDLSIQLNKNPQIIISTGAVSMGDFDFIPQTIKKLGGKIIFHKSKIRPGKPILFAKFPNGCLYFGLPGNPISAAIGLRFFVSLAIMKLLKLKQEKPLTAIATNNFNKKQSFRSILKAKSDINSNAEFRVKILDGQESFKIQPLLNANGWAMINEDVDQLSKGDTIDFYPSDINWNNT